MEKSCKELLDLASAAFSIHRPELARQVVQAGLGNLNALNSLPSVSAEIRSQTGAQTPHQMPVKHYTQNSDYTDLVEGAQNLFGLYFRGAGFSTWASFWSHWGGGITAEHCIRETRGWSPSHPQLDSYPKGFEPVVKLSVSDEVLRDLDGGFSGPPEIYLDAATASVELPEVPPVAPAANMRVKVYGFPAACTRQPEVRRGKLYIERIQWNNDHHAFQLSWIVVFDDDMVPVSGGMSGGLVVFAPDCPPGQQDFHAPRSSEIPVGITITLNSAANLDDDPHLEDGMDMTALYHVWAAMQGKRMNYSAGKYSPLTLDAGPAPVSVAAAPMQPERNA